jgi:antitoxin PrlF
MSVLRATLTSKGQLTVPHEIRSALNLKSGDIVEFILDEDGGVRFQAINLPLEALFAAATYNGPPKTIDDIEQGIAAGATEYETRRRKAKDKATEPVSGRSAAA